jgi:hypothetical protein
MFTLSTLQQRCQLLLQAPAQQQQREIDAFMYVMMMMMMMMMYVRSCSKPGLVFLRCRGLGLWYEACVISVTYKCHFCCLQPGVNIA